MPDTVTENKTTTSKESKVSYPDQEAVEIGENVVAQVNGNFLFLKIDLTHRGGESASGKSFMVASTGGNKTVPGTDEKTAKGGEILFGVNIYQKKPKAR